LAGAAGSGSSTLSKIASGVGAAGLAAGAANAASGGDLGKLAKDIWGLFKGGTSMPTQNNPTTSTGLEGINLGTGGLVDENYGGTLDYGTDWGDSSQTFDPYGTQFMAPSGEMSQEQQSENDLLRMTPEEMAYYYGY
jgi:hypothetical protein